ncbi:VOC family protein [Cryobacterium sp. N22]|uniref:bleomycin resistance protein n=1 Tax=Cryobacterium sp. N22 TaxID=2048290 RepID=UPI000CE49FEE|nr:VOC family protein [Cryobacterium sp. N22]
MKNNPLVPELSVRDLATSLNFYVRGVGFSVAYTRSDPSFAYLDLHGAQLMLEEDHQEAWVTGSLDGSRGAGVNLQIEILDVHAASDRLAGLGVRPFRELTESSYDTADGPWVQLEYLAQDPDGYLIRLVQRLSA